MVLVSVRSYTLHANDLFSLNTTPALVRRPSGSRYAVGEIQFWQRNNCQA